VYKPREVVFTELERTAPNHNETWLMAQIAAGDEGAFTALYQLHSPRLYTYLLRLTRDSQVSEDLLQNVFLAVWQGARQFRGDGKLLSWLYRIAHRQVIAWWRRNAPLAALSALFEHPAGRSDAEALLTQAWEQWESEQVRAALETLPPPQRAVLELSFGQGFSQQEIADIMECPIGTVKSRVKLALQQMGRVLQNTLAT
jgi:RNA polymerase sigma-70 factor (ECF subfamily)